VVTVTMTEFLLARIAEDEAAARAVQPLGYSIDMGGRRNDERWYVARLRFSGADGAARAEQDEEASQLFARHDPARVLAECEAKRRIVEGAPRAWDNDLENHHLLPAGQVILEHLAAVYADHPDYREEW